MNKNVKKLIISVAVLVVGVLIVIIGNSLATDDSTILTDQIIDNIAFKNASLEYKNEASTYTVELTNNNQNTYDLKYIKIKVTLPNNKEYVLIGYVGDSLASNETRTVKAQIDVDLTNATNISYTIVR